MKTPFGNTIDIRLGGESHAPEVFFVATGFPRGERIDFARLAAFMARRAPGRDATSTARRESDEPVFTDGVAGGVLTGGVLRGAIANRDTRPGDYGGEIRVPRPGHADYTAWVRDGVISTGGGRFSGRLTAPLCAAGGIALQILERRGIRIGARAVEIAGETDPARFEAAILAAKAAGDSVGGIVEVVVEGLPAGLGDFSFDGLEGRFSRAFFGIPAVKGVEFGAGFRIARMRGSEANDPFEFSSGRVVTRTNNCGGILGGISDGMPIVARLAFKPTPSIAIEQDSVDLVARENTKIAVKGRHDPCVVIRALPVVEAVAALVALDAVLEDAPDATADYRKVAIVTDSNVAPLHADRVEAEWRDCGSETCRFVFPAGERSKTLETYSSLLEFLAREHLSRTDAIVALGGGVTGDLAGFAAATYLRGIDFVQVPTTLLAAIDSSVGGKTGIDLVSGKNLAGAFHFPKKVDFRPEFLETLPQREYRAGLAEAVKCAIIGDERLFEALERDPFAVPAAEIVLACVALKRRIVDADPYERGERRLLNLGHTYGHAIEKLCGYRLVHGECVAIGTAIIARRAAANGICSDETAKRIIATLEKCGLPVDTEFTEAQMRAVMRNDKKNIAGALRFVVPERIGRCREHVFED